MNLIEWLVCTFYRGHTEFQVRTRREKGARVMEVYCGWCGRTRLRQWDGETFV